MREAAYRIFYNRDEARIDAVVRGYWNRALFDRYAIELIATADRARRSQRPFDIWCDSTEFAVQAPEIAEAFVGLSALADRLNGGRAAIVVDAALLKLQAQRVFRQANVRAFQTVDAARAWLAERRLVTA